MNIVRKVLGHIALSIFYLGFAMVGIALAYAVLTEHFNTEVSYKCVDGKHVKVVLDKRLDYITEETLENISCTEETN